MTPTQTAILNAFWSKGRKEFVPLTMEEIRRRSGVAKETLMGMARYLLHEDFIASQDGSSGMPTTYHLTPMAQRIVKGSWVA